MTLTICPNCGVRITVSLDDNCPNCHQPVTKSKNPFEDNPYESPEETSLVGIRDASMTTGEKIYSAMVFLCAGFFLMSLASFHFLVIPAAEEPGIFYFIMSIIWLYVLVLAGTNILNLYHRSLLTIPTIVQCAVLTLAVYFIPFAIWGGVLLRRRLQREKAAG